MQKHESDIARSNCANMEIVISTLLERVAHQYAY